METLARHLPGFGDEHEQLRTKFLWDRLYPDLDDFAIAASRWEPTAVARLVQVAGMYAAERALGPKIWQRFDTYKDHIHPARRRELMSLVQWHENRTHR